MAAAAERRSIVPWRPEPPERGPTNRSRGFVLLAIGVPSFLSGWWIFIAGGSSWPAWPLWIGGAGFVLHAVQNITGIPVGYFLQRPPTWQLR